ncbi:MAG: sugar phosphate isomerase/epimerase [Firmicutes bacterium]|nr:sugar phosphate isomerase/epimerase [Bacillota bacterium]
MQWRERCGILTDEVSEDFHTALEWVGRQGLGAVEIRQAWGNNVVDLRRPQIRAMAQLLREQGLAVAGIASPVFKCALDPARAPVTAGDRFGTREEPVARHYEWLETALELAAALDAPHVRIFSFWREARPDDHRSAILDHLGRASALAEAYRIPLVLENEPACNGGSHQEVVDLVRAVGSPYLLVLWDPGNDAFQGKMSFERLTLPQHVHLKDVAVRPTGGRDIVPLGRGVVPWRDILAGLNRDGYLGRYVLEPHVKDEEGLEASVRGLWDLLDSSVTEDA